MTGGPDSETLWLEQYLDGQLEGEAAVRAAARMREDAYARMQAVLQARIDESLRRLFEPGAGRTPSGEVAKAGVRRSAPRALRWPLRTVGALAASVALAAGGAWLALSFRPPDADRLTLLYQVQMRAGFVPRDACTDAEAFTQWVRRQLGQRVYIRPAPGVELVGWTYGHAITPYSRVLLARVDQTPVVVVADLARREHRPLPDPQDPALRVTRRRLGMLVLYEISTLPQPRILPLLSDEPPQ